MMRPAPSTGTATRAPGYGVWALKPTAAPTMSANPTQVSAAAVRLGTRRSQVVATATSAPRASSQARVNGEK